VSGEEVLYKSPYMYQLVRAPDGTLIIEVVVGGFALYEVRVRLNEEEAASYAREGTAFTDRMAQAIVASPAYGGRSES
jgi:hypothetical protein